MIVLGVADQPAPSATVVADDRLVAHVSGEQLGELPDAPIPWDVVEAALDAAGVTPADVDTVAVAGRFSPPLLLRRYPFLRRFVLDATGPLLEPFVAFQAALRHSGLGAYAADVAREWLDDAFRERGFRHGRLLTVDAQKALAEAAYRLQPDDDVLIVGLQPLADGVGLAVHRGRAGQVDRLWVQRGFEAIHTHVPRVVAALGLDDTDPARLDGLAARGTPTAALQRLLAEDLRPDGRRLSQGRFRGPAPHPLDAALRAADRADAAAAVLDNLAQTVCTLVRRHVRAHGLGRVALVGEVFDHPRLVARVAEVEGVHTVSVVPRPGRDALSLGAAASLAGLAPHAPSWGLGPAVSGDAAVAALDAARLSSARRATLVDRLCRGEAVLRFRERPGPGRHGLGARAVLVRADDAYALQRVREALQLPPDEEPLTLTIPTPNEGAMPFLDALRGPLAVGMAAPTVDASFARRYAPVVAPDGRARLMRVDEATHPGLHALIKGLLRASGCGALAAFPLVQGDRAPVADPANAVALYRRAGFGALQLGAYYVERDAAA